VGPDRIVDAVGAIDRYGAPCIVIDFGTANTIDAINAKGSTWAARSHWASTEPPRRW